jgi:tripartite motif-containing protein 2/3
LADAEAKNLNDLQMLINEAKDKIDYCQNQYMKLENYLADLQDQNKTTRGYIEQTYQSYKSLVEKRRVSWVRPRLAVSTIRPNRILLEKDEMLKELNERHAQEELAVMDMHGSIDTCISQITDTVRFTELTLKNGNRYVSGQGPSYLHQYANDRTFFEKL